MSKKVRIQTTIDKDIYEKIIQKYLPKYESLNRVIENAIRTYDSFIENIGQEPSERDFLILRMVREIGMILLSYETVDAGASGNLKKIIEENELRILLEWYFKRSIDKISIDEVVKFMKVILPAMNVALSVDVQKFGKEIHVIVSSRMKKDFNTLLCEVIKISLERHFDVFVDYSVFPHGFEIIIK
ncbi:MAG: hypothetical protein NZ879_01520 [Archaeoglobaceae archaeon]|nr:hypothetical protein [Archaeoglobaceae archaeon]MDW8117643.1 hypothetical protein [Archaeoglobaceae archaeon]